MKKAQAIYIDSGAWQAGEEDSSILHDGYKGTFSVVRDKDLKKLNDLIDELGAAVIHLSYCANCAENSLDHCNEGLLVKVALDKFRKLRKIK